MGYIYAFAAVLCGSIKGFCGKQISSYTEKLSSAAYLNFLRMLICIVMGFVLAFIIVPNGELKDLALSCENEKIYKKLETREVYIQAIIDYISGMTDRFAIVLFNELLQY